MVQSFRAWIFTLNNPLVAELPQNVVNLFEFLTYQLEKGERGTPHLQGYFILKANPRNKNGRTFKWVKEHVGANMHLEPRKGTHAQAVHYNNKPIPHCNCKHCVGAVRIDGPWTIGTWDDKQIAAKEKGGNVNKSKILSVKRAIDDGVPDKQIWQDNFGEMLRYGKAFDRYRLTRTVTFRTEQSKAVWFYGPPHTGKSHRALQFARKIDPNPHYIDLSGGTAWFDGMQPGCKVIVIEDFLGNAPISFMLKLLDHTPLQVQTKGSMMPFSCNWVIFTSNKHPRDVYGAKPDSVIPLEILNAWSDRFTGDRGCVIEMATRYEKPEGVSVASLFDHIDKQPDAQPEMASNGRLSAKIIDLIDPVDQVYVDQGDGSESSSHRHMHGECSDTDCSCKNLHDNDDGDDEDDDDNINEDDDNDDDQPDEVDDDGFDAEDIQEHLLASGQLASSAEVEAVKKAPPSVTAGTPLRRSDTTQFGIERVKDTRWGPQPTQSKLSLTATPAPKRLRFGDRQDLPIQKPQHFSTGNDRIPIPIEDWMP